MIVNIQKDQDYKIIEAIVWLLQEGETISQFLLIQKMVQRKKDTNVNAL